MTTARSTVQAASAGPALSQRLGRAIRNAHLWLPGYLRARVSRLGDGPPKHVWVVVADHFEPLGFGASIAAARSRVDEWRQKWPRIAERHVDSDGRHPRYTFFYPEEEYRPELLDPLAELTGARVADVEVHLHHDGESGQEFCDRMGRFLERLHRGHGLLRVVDGSVAFGFIHGNWALDNSRPDGRWCGINDEITLLHRLGCYADFTLPAAPDPSQTGPVNVIFRVTDEPDRPRSHRRGVPVAPGGPATGHLTLIPGPLGLLWGGRRRFVPRVDTGEIAGYFAPSRDRVRLWLRVAPRIAEHAFVKLFAHGAQDRNAGPLLDRDLGHLFESLSAECSSRGAALHYVTAWEMFRAVEALRTRAEPLAVLREPALAR